MLAPTHCLSKARRGRRRPGSGDSDEQDDDYGDGGGNDGSGGSGGDSGDWGDDEDQHGRNLFESMWLWQALCLCSFLQVIKLPASSRIVSVVLALVAVLFISLCNTCQCSVLRVCCMQAVHYLATGSRSGEAAEIGALASLTHSFYNTRHSQATCHA